MKKIRPTFVSDAHAYTRAKLPWLLDAYTEAKGETTTGKKFGWKLFHYIAGGGMKFFGRSVEQELADAQQTRFLVVAAVLGAVWLALLFT